MDKWLRQSTTNKNQQKGRQDIQDPRISDRKRRHDDEKALQQALEASRAEAQQDDRYARDLEQATWLSRRESALHHTTIHVKPFGSSRLKTVTKEKSDDCGEWVVDSFLSNVLNQSSSVTKRRTHDEPIDSSQEERAESIPDDDDTAPEDNEEWEIRYDSETDDLYQVPPDQTGHDDQAEAGFFGQLRRETWDTGEIRSSHAAAKKRSVTDVIKKNKRIKTTASYSSSEHNYYATGDDVLEGDVVAAGFNDSVAGLSWEGVGQTRYA